MLFLLFCCYWCWCCGVVDDVVTEPLGGAHRDQVTAITALGDSFENQLKSMAGMSAEELITDRAQKYMLMGDKGLA